MIPHESAWVRMNPLETRMITDESAWQRMNSDGPKWTLMDPDEPEWTLDEYFFYLVSRRFSVKWTLLRKKIFFGWNFFFEKNSKFSSKFLGIFFSEEFLQKCSVHARWCTEGGYAAINILTVQSIKLKHIFSTNWFFGLLDFLDRFDFLDWFCFGFNLAEWISILLFKSKKSKRYKNQNFSPKNQNGPKNQASSKNQVVLKIWLTWLIKRSELTEIYWNALNGALVSFISALPISWSFL